MRRPRRLRTRIVWSTALIAALAMIAIIGTVVLGLTAITRNSVRATLDDRFDVLSGALATTRDGGANALETPDDGLDDTTWLYGPRGAEIDGPRASTRTQRVADALARVERRTRVTRGERVYLSGPVRIGGSPSVSGVLVVSESLEPYEATRTESIAGLALVGLLVTAGATGIAAWTVTRTLHPVESMAESAEAWSAQQLDARFDERGGDDEIAHLGRTLNVLLDRVAGALRGEQRLTSELAHELRTPLTAIRGEAELASMQGADPQTLERLDRVVALTDRMSGTITTLLDIARGAATSGRATTLGAVLDAALAGRPPGRVPLRAERDPATEVVRIAASADVVARALSPLLDNAERYAASAVVVSGAVLERTVVLSVSDDGPGVPQQDPATLFDAGVRAGPVGDGVGLGLALARRAARSLAGDVTVTSTASPTTFALTLPRA